MRLVALLAFALSCSSPPAAPPRPPPFPGFFPIGMYVAAERLADAWEAATPLHLGRPAVETYARALDDMANHGINVIAVENTSAIPTEMLRRMVRLGYTRGIRLWASENGLPPDAEIPAWTNARHARFREEPGLLAWSLWDEPLGEQMERWLRIKKILEASDPIHPVIAVTHGGPKGFERHHVAHAYDYYPILIDRSDPLSIGPMVRRYVEEARGAPVWFVQQAFRGEGRRLPTPAESRLMTFVAIAHGARGIFHFIYDHVTDPINAPSPLWDEIGAMSWRLAALGPVLLDSRPVEAAPWVALATVSGSVSVAVLSVRSGGAVVLVYNTSASEPAEATLKAARDPLIDLNSMHRLTQLTVKLAPGDGAFYGIEKTVAEAVRAGRTRCEQERSAAELKKRPAELEEARAAAARLYARIQALRERGHPDARALRNRYWGLASAFLALESEFLEGASGLPARAAELRTRIERLERELPE